MQKVFLAFFFLLLGSTAQAQFDSIQTEVLKGRKLEIKEYDSLLNVFRPKDERSNLQYIFYYEKSWNFIRKARYDSAYYFAEKGLQLAIQKNDSAQLLSFYKGVGITYYYNAQKEKSKSAFKKALDYRTKKTNKFNIAALYNNLGGIYTDENILDSAIVSLKKAIELFKSIGDSALGNQLQSRRILATAYYMNKENELAKKLLYEISREAKLINHATQQTSSLIYLATILESEGELEKALGYLKEAYQIQRKEDNKSTMLMTVGNLSKHFASLRIYDSAYHYTKEENVLRSKIYELNISDNVSKLEVKHETNRIRIEKEIAIQNEKNKSLLLEISERNSQLYLGFGIGIVLLLFGVIFSLYKQRELNKIKHQKNIQLERTHSLIVGENKERERLSRELHDGVSQLLAGVKINLNALNINDEKLNSLLDKSIKEVRNISHDLMPEELKNQELNEALKSLFYRYHDLKSPKVTMLGNVSTELIDTSKKHLYRIVQELLTNGVKHSGASVISFEFTTSSNLVSIIYKDNGIGLTKEMLSAKSGIGWKNILARLELLNGNVTIQKEANSTNILKIVIPTTNEK